MSALAVMSSFQNRLIERHSVKLFELLLEASKWVPKAIVLELWWLLKFEKLHHNCVQLPFPGQAFTPNQSFYLWIHINELVFGIVLYLGFGFNFLGDQSEQELGRAVELSFNDQLILGHLIGGRLSPDYVTQKKHITAETRVLKDVEDYRSTDEVQDHSSGEQDQRWDMDGHLSFVERGELVLLGDAPVALHEHDHARQSDQNRNHDVNWCNDVKLMKAGIESPRHPSILLLHEFTVQ